MANTIIESGSHAKNDEIGDAGNGKSDLLVCYTLTFIVISATS